jgi:hypothetical protein
MVQQTPPNYPAHWSQLTSEQKRQWRYDGWRRSADEAEFANPEARTACATRLERMIGAYNLEERDRVPFAASTGLLPLYAAGLDYRTAIYHPEKTVAAIRAFNREHADELDNLASWGFVGLAAPALDALDIKIYAYPGHGMSLDAMGFQFVEGEYMGADEYDAFIRDPSDFWLRTYLPRVFGSLEPLAQLTPLTDVVEINTMQLWGLARPEVQAMLERLLEAGRELNRFTELRAIEQSEALVYGFPPGPRAYFAKAPFDTIGDTLRGTRQIIMDMFRQPEKLLHALDVVADLTIRTILDSPDVAGAVAVRFPLHKGADGWMSEEQFLQFYWPTLHRVIDALVNEGLLVSLFAEGNYNSRLGLVGGFPKGAVTWMFDRTDMAQAKRILGNTCSIQGNVPSSLLVTGSPVEVKEECRRLIEICAPGGGYILGPGALPEHPKVENLKAMAQAAREYGVYRTA